MGWAPWKWPLGWSIKYKNCTGNFLQEIQLWGTQEGRTRERGSLNHNVVATESFVNLMRARTSPSELL